MKYLIGIFTAFMMMFSTAYADDNPFGILNSSTGPFVGIRGGYSAGNHRPEFGVNAGYDFYYGRLEANYDYLGRRNSNLYTGNIIAQYHFDKITPYALIGFGYVTNPVTYFNQTQNFNTSVVNFGGGIRYNVTENIGLDLRYRYVYGLTDYSNIGRYKNSLITVGLEYKF